MKPEKMDKLQQRTETALIIAQRAWDNAGHRSSSGPEGSDFEKVATAILAAAILQSIPEDDS